MKSVDKLNGKIDSVRLFQNEVAKKTISLNYSMRDKLTAISISMNNYNICKNALEVSKEMGNASEEVILEVYILCKKFRFCHIMRFCQAEVCMRHLKG